MSRIHLQLAAALLVITGCSDDNNQAPAEVTAPTPAPTISLINTQPFTTNDVCPTGGIEINAGVDSDLDGALGADEVTTTNYLCHGESDIGTTMALVSSSSFNENEVCPQGGLAIASGQDINGNGILEDNEISKTDFLCHGEDGADGSQGLSALLQTEDISNTEFCPEGGIAISSGLDINNNSTLDKFEITSTQYLCHGTAGSDGQNGLNALIQSKTIEAGAVCAAGGIQISTGIDSNNDTILSPEEVTATELLCHGVDGEDGQDGVQALISSESFSANATCPAGGIAIFSGLDSNRNTLLDSEEISSTQYLCHGIPGADGLNSLITTTSIAPGAQCAQGGVEISAGLDLNANNQLDPDEITASEILCNGENGSDGQDTSTPLVISDETGVEGDTLVFTLSLSAPATESLEFTYGTLTSTATNSDFVPVAGRVTYAPGEQVKQVSVELVADAQCEDNEFLVLQVSSNGGNASGFGEILSPHTLANCDIDKDDDGLIEITSLQQLDWMRNNLQGTSLIDNEGTTLTEGCGGSGCNGYELMTDLDFDSNGNGLFDAGDTFYNGGKGWVPVGGEDIDTYFEGNFDGNNHFIRNLVINHPGRLQYVGLFGLVKALDKGLSFSNVNFDGPLTSVTGSDFASLFMGRFDKELTTQAASSSFRNISAAGSLQLDAGRPSTQRNYTNAGIVGAFYSEGFTSARATVIIEDISFEGTITNNGIDDLQDVGGLIGALSAREYTTMTVSGCSSNTSITASGGNRSYSIGLGFGNVGVLAQSNLAISDCHIEGDLSIITANASQEPGGLIGDLYLDEGALTFTINRAAVSANIESDQEVGLLIGNIYGGSDSIAVALNNIFTTGSVNALYRYGGGIIGNLYLSEPLTMSMSYGYNAAQVTSANMKGGIVGRIIQSLPSAPQITADFNNIYNRSDEGLTPFDPSQTLSDFFVDINELNNIQQKTIAELQCPISTTDTNCGVNIFENWTDPAWDFGTSTQLPGLIIKGVTYRDNDGDGRFD